MSHRPPPRTGPESLDTACARSLPDAEKHPRPLGTSIVKATQFTAASSEDLGDRLRSRSSVYARSDHPTVEELARKIARLEGAEAARVFPSGMAAVATLLVTLLKPGDHVVLQRDLFPQTRTFLRDHLESSGVASSRVDPSRPGDVKAALRESTRLVYIETPSTPRLTVVDVAAISRIARARAIPVAVDATNATPVLQRTLSLGASLVLHSGSKFLGGHGDLMFGAVAGDRALLERIRRTQIYFGGILDPDAAWLALRSLKTLAVRVRRQSETALELARFLATLDVVPVVHHPWLETSPTVDLARRQMTGGGGLVSFEISGGLRRARAFVDALELIPITASFGGTETTVSIPAEMTMDRDELARRERAMDDVLVRLSVGLEHPDDLKSDLARGAAAAAQGEER